MSERKNGGPAFAQHKDWPYDETDFSGLSMRDWFAGQALATLLIEANRNNPPEQVAHWAYKLADAMLQAREQSHE